VAKILLVSILALVPMITFCGPMGLANLDRMVRDAKLIVVARVVQGSQSGKFASFTLEVQRTLKGEPPSSTVSAFIEVMDTGNINLKGWQGLWFIAEDGRLLPATSGSVLIVFCRLPALPELPAAWAAPNTASPTERVLRELSASLEAEEGYPFLAEILSQKSATEPAASLRALYRRMQASPSLVVAGAGVAGLLRSGDVGGLRSLPALLEKGPLPPGPLVGASVCEYLNGNPSGLSILSALAAVPSPTPLLRTCAAFALRNIHSKESIPYLLGLLGSDDFQVRYEGMAGLASYANSGFVPGEKPLSVDDVVQPRIQAPLRTEATSANFPTFDRFKLDEAVTIAFWRQWVSDNVTPVAPQAKP
jgi:hypothetical protein